VSELEIQLIEVQIEFYERALDLGTGFILIMAAYFFFDNMIKLWKM
jgi:hypothetical protein